MFNSYDRYVDFMIWIADFFLNYIFFIMQYRYRYNV